MINQIRSLMGFGSNHKNNDLVRMFEVEYRNETKNARKNGIEVDAAFVTKYLANR